MGDKRSFSSHHFQASASVQPISARGDFLVTPSQRSKRLGSSMAIPKYSTTVCFSVPCGVGLAEKISWLSAMPPFSGRSCTSFPFSLESRKSVPVWPEFPCRISFRRSILLPYLRCLHHPPTVRGKPLMVPVNFPFCKTP